MFGFGKAIEVFPIHYHDGHITFKSPKKISVGRSVKVKLLLAGQDSPTVSVKITEMDESFDDYTGVGQMKERPKRIEEVVYSMALAGVEGACRRATKRVTATVRLRSRQLPNYRGITANINETGVEIHTDGAMTVGVPVTLEFDVPEMVNVAMTAVTIWSIEVPNPAGKSTYRVGAEFTESDPRTLDAWSTYYRRILDSEGASVMMKTMGDGEEAGTNYNTRESGRQTALLDQDQVREQTQTHVEEPAKPAFTPPSTPTFSPQNPSAGGPPAFNSTPAPSGFSPPGSVAQGPPAFTPPAHNPPGPPTFSPPASAGPSSFSPPTFSPPVAPGPPSFAPPTPPGPPAFAPPASQSPPPFSPPGAPPAPPFGNPPPFQPPQSQIHQPKPSTINPSPLRLDQSSPPPKPPGQPSLKLDASGPPTFQPSQPSLPAPPSFPVPSPPSFGQPAPPQFGSTPSFRPPPPPTPSFAPPPPPPQSFAPPPPPPERVAPVRMSGSNIMFRCRQAQRYQAGGRVPVEMAFQLQGHTNTVVISVQVSGIQQDADGLYTCIGVVMEDAQKVQVLNQLIQ